MRRVLLRIWADLRRFRNLELYVTALIAIVFIVLNVLNVNATRWNPALLNAFMVLLSLQLLSLGDRGGQLQAAILHLTPPNIRAADLFAHQDDLTEMCKQIDEARHRIWIWGTTLHRSVPSIKLSLEYAIRRGVRVRILMIDPDSTLATTLTAHSRRSSDPQSIQRKAAGALAELTELARTVQGASGLLEVRLIDDVGPYRLFACDAGRDQGQLVIKMRGYGQAEPIRPRFIVTSDDGRWYDYFRDEFDRAWGAGTIRLNTRI